MQECVPMSRQDGAGRFFQCPRNNVDLNDHHTAIDIAAGIRASVLVALWINAAICMSSKCRWIASSTAARLRDICSRTATFHRPAGFPQSRQSTQLQPCIQSPSPPRFPFRAVSMQSIKTGPENGLARKQMAPAFIARVRRLSSGKAVIKINGTSLPRMRICVRRSKPLMTGICTSAMTHDESSRWADCKKSTADANVRTRYPWELRRLLVAPRTDTSSSIIEITESVDKSVFLKRERGA
jgi:hypothetical protein